MPRDKAAAVEVDRSLEATTETGRRFVGLCQEHAADFATRADEHDRDSSFPVENVKAMQESDALAACVPSELGGMGLASLHDLAVGVNRLGRGDGSTAISVAMHLSATFVAARTWRAATARGEHADVEGLGAMLGAVAARSLVACVLGTEAGAMSFYPVSELTPVAGGYHLNGRKIFSTLSPAADLLLVVARLRQGAADLLVLVPVGAHADGVEQRDDWDALGMRASGSQDIVFTDVFVPADAPITQGPWGGPSVAGLLGQVVGSSALSGAFLGIAEAAQRIAVELVTTRRKVPSTGPLAERAAIQRVIAENEVDLSTSRACLERSTTFADSVLDGLGPDGLTLDTMHRVMAEAQMSKLHVQLRAVDVVDRALTASGGAGYMSASPLSRLYRDVRAGPFMQQYSPIEAYEYIGKVTLGLDPKLDL